MRRPFRADGHVPARQLRLVKCGSANVIGHRCSSR
jgi:hypothetical protein